MESVPLPIFSEVKAAAQKPRGLPFLRLGFRPFYLGGTLVAALAVPLWVALFMGGISNSPVVPALLWHAHEMLFGFAVAIIIGFLMTAGKNWTGLSTPRGASLAALALLWLGARITALTGPGVLYALLDMALLPLVAGILARLLLGAKNYRNLPLALILALLAAANLVFHLATLGVLDVPAMTPLHAALGLIIMIESVIAGRVVPAFTMSATPGLRIQRSAIQERLTLGLTALGLLLWVFAPAGVWGLLVLLAAAGLHAIRLWSWRPLRTRHKPILWILHGAYAWIALGLLLLALAQMGWIPVSAGVHALAVGATGGLIIGMVTRTARGHTGRPLALSRLEVAAYALVMAAAALRVLVPLLWPGLYMATLILAAAAWCAAFLIYLWIYSPWLLQTRLDGKDG
ncbi:NnrS family protein [Rhodoferax sp.]|uniref:NnrS family protein n=1 Tax=Rhodoferax sp. TaxID=50421 RepID=UPI00263736FD|nr:NnrS family protein [Rhodoferax sp.]MDD3934699.1 NnrS family protein [Rhodoferax sp.]